MPDKIYPIDGGKASAHPPEAPPRRLAAILAADIAGYSHLMGIDEEGTHARVKRYRRELIDPTIAEHHGRLIKNTGDGFIAMFDSPVEAVRCAIVIQQSMVGRNASLPRPQWILYRIGVNLGDVIVEPDDIYGDGVNVAARLEGLANPGQVYISGGVYEQIKHKLVCGYQSLGDRKVKNITDPVSVYRVLPDPAAVIEARHLRRLAAILAFSIAAIAVVGAVSWFYLMRQPAQVAIQVQPPTPAEPPQLAPQPAPIAAPTAPPVASQSTPPTVSAAPQVTAQPETVTTPATPQVAVTAPPRVVRLEPVREPELASLPGGTFVMGSRDDPSEMPVHHVSIKPFAISKFPITVREWNTCVTAKACTYMPTGKDDAPVTNLSWSDTQQFIAWLSQVTQKTYRLPSEAEWEYAARGGTETRFWWGDQVRPGLANCNGCNEPYDASQPLHVGSFKPNPFGLYDMGGGVDEWMADCWHKNYQGAPVDGSTWVAGDCSSHVLRGGSWKNDPSYVRPASRDHYDTGVRYPTHGFRIARSL